VHFRRLEFDECISTRPEDVYAKYAYNESKLFEHSYASPAPRNETRAGLQPYYYRTDPKMPTNPTSGQASDQTLDQDREQPLIQAQNVSRQYRLGEAIISAVNDISLEIRAGEFVALLGSSGSGKSTFLNLLAGLDRPTSGAIHVRGRNLAAIDSTELARYRRDTVGMVFQSFNLLPRMTLEENVELPLRLAEVERGEREGRVATALEHVGLGARRRHRPSELSGGEQQRGALARALVNRPAILFADEPTGNLDSANGEQILLLLREIQATLGMTIIMVTHERPLAERFANRIAVLSDGRLVSDTAQAPEDVGAGLQPGFGVKR
jgi:putative ABC transport system ATP-binding protein